MVDKNLRFLAVGLCIARRTCYVSHVNWGVARHWTQIVWVQFSEAKYACQGFYRFYMQMLWTRTAQHNFIELAPDLETFANVSSSELIAKLYVLGPCIHCTWRAHDKRMTCLTKCEHTFNSSMMPKWWWYIDAWKNVLANIQPVYKDSINEIKLDAHVHVQSAINGLIASMNSETWSPSFRCTSPAPSQKKGGDNFVTASERITCNQIGQHNIRTHEHCICCLEGLTPHPGPHANNFRCGALCWGTRVWNTKVDQQSNSISSPISIILQKLLLYRGWDETLPQINPDCALNKQSIRQSKRISRAGIHAAYATSPGCLSACQTGWRCCEYSRSTHPKLLRGRGALHQT